MTKSNNIRRLLALFVIVASLSLVAVIVLKIYKGRVKKELLRKLPQHIDVSLNKIHFTETREGVKKWDLVADRAEYDKREDVTHLTGVRLIVDTGGKMGDITMTAPRADYHNVTRDVRMDGKVFAKSSSGMEFTTEDAEYIAARGVIVSGGRVRFSNGKLTIEGVGMEFRPETKNLRILNGVTASIVPGAGK
jgi:LPS export ABC transporter protein LptC